MNLQIALLLGQDGVTNGAIYVLMALSIVLVFTVTRILFVPQGEFVTFGAMTMAALQTGSAPPLAWLALVLAVLRLCQRIWTGRSARTRGDEPLLGWRDGIGVAYALALLAITHAPSVATWPMPVHALLAVAVVAPLGTWLYDLCFRPIASASGLVLLIVAIALHVILVGLALWMFGAEGAQTQPFTDATFALGPVTLKAQSVWVLAVTLGLIAALFIWFERTLRGKALRATAVNRLGAQLMGISPERAGRASVTLAAAIGALSGVLIAPVTTLYYDSGFLISLKGFVGAVVGGLISFPIAALGAFGVGMVEAFSTFWASDYKDVLVFTLILPILLWRSLATRHVEEEH